MAVSQADIQAWFAANPGATDQQIAQAMQQFGVGTAQVAQATGVGLDDVTRRFNAATGRPEWESRSTPQQLAAQPAAQPANPYGLSRNSTGAETANAYQSYLQSIGSKDTESTRNTARDYLLNLGMTRPDIDSAYSSFRANQPQLAGEGDLARQSSERGVALQDPTKYAQQNPYLDQMGESVTRQVTDNLQRNILPGISSSAVSSGNFGGSRQGVVEANALKDANRGLSDALTNMRFGDYNNTMSRQLQKYGQDQGYNLGLTNANNSFYTAQRGQDLQQVGLGASIFQQSNQGMLNQGQGVYNLGLTGQQAPWQSMQNFGGVAQPYTGFGSTTGRETGSAGAGFLGGALAGSQAYNIFSNGNSNPMGIQNTDGFTNTPNYLRFPA